MSLRLQGLSQSDAAVLQVEPAWPSATCPLEKVSPGFLADVWEQLAHFGYE